MVTQALSISVDSVEIDMLWCTVGWSLGATAPIHPVTSLCCRWWPASCCFAGIR